MLFLLLACDAPPAPSPSLDLTVEVSVDEATGTTLTVRWDTVEPATAALELGPDEGYGRTVEGWSSDDGLEHAVTVVGLAPGAPWHWRAVADYGGALGHSDDQTFEPASPPAALPPLAVTGEWDGMVIVPVIHGTTSWVTLYDSTGRPMWWTKVDTALAPITQARVTHDGRAVVYLHAAEQGSTGGEIVRVPFAGGADEPMPVGLAHHDFVEVEAGRYAVIISDQRERAGTPIEGDALAEVTEAGAEIVWSTWDDLPLPPGGAGPTPLDWTHLNGVAWDGARWWLSSYQLESLILVDPAEGLMGVIGGAESTYELLGGDGFGPQHSPLPTDTGFLLFNNREPDDEGTFSEATAYTVNHATHTYERAWTYIGVDPVYSPIFGSVEATGGGDVLVSWGTAGRVSVVDPEGALRWEGQTPLAYGLGFAHPVGELATSP